MKESTLERIIREEIDTKIRNDLRAYYEKIYNLDHTSPEFFEKLNKKIEDEQAEIAASP